jgi:hypothetical protein
LIAAEVAVAASQVARSMDGSLDVLGKENAAWDYVQHHLMDWNLAAPDRWRTVGASALLPAHHGIDSH